MSKNKYARFFALLKQANSNGLILTKEQAVLAATGGVSDSLSSLSMQQLWQAEQYLQGCVAPVPEHNSKNSAKTDAMRKAIISQFKSIGRTTQQAIAWAEKYGVHGKKKSFNDYDEKELIILIRNAEKVKSDWIDSVTK